MREIRQSGSEGGAMQTNVSSLPLSKKEGLPYIDFKGRPSMLTRTKATVGTSIFRAWAF